MKVSHVVCALAVASRILSGQSGPRVPGRIIGIFDAVSSTPIEGAEVTDIFTDATARTPTNGLIELSAFQSRHDSAAIRIRKIGYSDTALVVMVGRADTIPLQLFLSKATATLPAMITEAITKDNRFMHGLGDFVDLMNDKSTKSTVFTPADLRKSDGRQLEDMLFDKGIGATTRCQVPRIQTYVDGIKQTQLGMPVGMSVTDFEAAIFYPGNSMPAAYNMTGLRGCGTLLLWTRRNVLP